MVEVAALAQSQPRAAINLLSIQLRRIHFGGNQGDRND